MADKHTKKRSPELLAKLIYWLSQSANVAKAARNVGISRELAYRWFKQSKEGQLPEPNSVPLAEGEDPLPLHEAWVAALETATDHLEEVAEHLATGYDKPLTFQGRVMMRWDDEKMEHVPETIKEYDTRMLEILLKARRPEKFRENYNIKHSGEVKTGVLVVPGLLSEEAWQKRAMVTQREARERSGKPDSDD